MTDENKVSFPSVVEEKFTVRAVISVVLAWLLPGAGHFYLGRRGKAVIFLLIVTFSLLFGFYLDGKLYTPEKGKLLSFFGTFASLGIGPSYFLLTADKLGNVASGNMNSFTFDYGNLFTLVAGLMNVLLMIDSFDTAMGRKP